MKIFVSYSFREENAWIESYVIPLISCFGHEPKTGRILDAGPIHDEIKRLIRGCRRVICFVTRAAPIYGPDGRIAGYTPPDWVRDELIIARGASVDALEFREQGVTYGGAASFSAWHPFNREDIPPLLLRLAEVLKDWPVGPLLLRLAVPDALRADMEQAATAGTLRARCTALDREGSELSAEDLDIRVLDNQLVVPFWIKPRPDMAIDIAIALGPRRLVCKGISPAVCVASLKSI
jgi:hypothetical protein